MGLHALDSAHGHRAVAAAASETPSFACHAVFLLLQGAGFGASVVFWY